jgi:hypothetical protein
MQSRLYRNYRLAEEGLTLRDGCSRLIVGWAIDERLHTVLVTTA